MELLHIVHPLAECVRELVGIVIVILAVERLSDIDAKLSSLKRSLPRMRPFLCPRPDLISARDVNRDERDSGLYRDISGTVLHGSQVTVVSPRSFGEYEADVAFLDFLLGLDESSYGIAVSVDGDASSDLHDEPSEVSVVCFEIGAYKSAHPLEVPSGEEFIDEDAVGKTLVVGSDDVRIILGKIISSYAFKVCKQTCKPKESDLGKVTPYASFGRILLIKMLMMIFGIGCVLIVFRHLAPRSAVKIYTYNIVNKC